MLKSAESPLTTNNKKEDNPRVETLMKTRLLLLLAGFFALESACLAQGSKPGQSAPSPGPTTTAGDPTKYLNRDWENVYNQGRTGDHLRGNVILAEGALPWDAIPVVVMCDGKAQFTTTTDSHGDFVIARVLPVTSTTIIGTEKSLLGQLVGCSVSAVLPGFDSSQLTIANRDVLAHPNIGTITLKRESGAAGTAVSTITATAPKSAMKSFEKARSEWLDNKPDRAQRDLQRAVEIYPQFAEAWYQLGKIQEKVKSPAAWESFAKAAAADPKFALPYEHLAPMSAQAEKWREVIDETNRALELNPRGTLDLWYYNALGNYHLKSLDMAETSANKSLAMDPLHVQPDTEQLLAVILVARNDLPSALQHLRNCLTYFPPGPNYELVKRQIAQIEPAVAASQNDKGHAATIENKKQLETLSTLNVLPSSEPASADLAEKSSSNAKAAPAARNSRWLLPGVDELAPPVWVRMRSGRCAAKGWKEDSRICGECRAIHGHGIVVPGNAEQVGRGFGKGNPSIRVHRRNPGDAARNADRERISGQWTDACRFSGWTHYQGIAGAFAYFPSIRHERFFNEMRGPRLPERATNVADLFSAESR